jgi:sec-independent protein translocase protein TatA
LTSGAKDLGKAVNEFKKGVRDEDKPAQLSDQSNPNASNEAQHKDDTVQR